jgi:hypothetical protein
VKNATLDRPNHGIKSDADQRQQYDRDSSISSEVNARASD